MTACSIGVQQGDLFVGICVQQNGEPAHVGAILCKYYDSVRSNTLVRYGDVDSLGATIGLIHNSETSIHKTVVAGIELPVPDQTTFYGRDLGKTDLVSEKFFNADKLKDFYATHRDCHHSYVRGKHGWLYYDAELVDWIHLSDMFVDD